MTVTLEQLDKIAGYYENRACLARELISARSTISAQRRELDAATASIGRPLKEGESLANAIAELRQKNHELAGGRITKVKPR